MNFSSHCSVRSLLFVFLAGIAVSSLPAFAEPLPLKRAVDLALSHSTTAGMAAADEKRSLSAYYEARNQYIPQAVVGSGLGKSWGFPLSLEGSAPSVFNVNIQSALLNPALRDFVKATRTEWKAAELQTKDQRNLVIQDTVLTYMELHKWESMLEHLGQDVEVALKAVQFVNQRVQEGVDSKLDLEKARLATARARLRMAQMRGAIAVLRDHLAQLTGVPAASLEIVPSSIPQLPEVLQTDDLAAKAAQSNPIVQAAEERATALSFRARGEHRALWPSVDFAAQYALLSKYNNYEEFFKTFQRHNATVGGVIRFPFLNFSQRARAQGADAAALRAKHEAQAAKNQVSEETLKLQRSVEQLAAAQQVADLESQIAQSGLEAVQIRLDSGGANLHDVEDARTQANERYNALQDANFELQRAQVALLRATGELDSWVESGK